MFKFLKNIFSFFKSGPSQVEIALVKGLVDSALATASTSKQFVQVEVDLQNKVSKTVAQVVLNQLAQEYSQKLGKPVSLTPTNCF